MDISKIVFDNIAPCKILAPDGSKTDIEIDLFGVDSKERQVAIKNMVASIPKDGSSTDEESEARGVELLAECIPSWSNVSDNGEELKCTKENKIRVLTEHRWIKAQVDSFGASRANFLQKA
jgi:ABC-type antimicrobial peptide transport system ATPase subunit